MAREKSIRVSEPFRQYLISLMGPQETYEDVLLREMNIEIEDKHTDYDGETNDDTDTESEDEIDLTG